MNYEPSGPDEAAYLAAYDPSKFPIVMHTVDVVALDVATSSVLLIKRGKWPYMGHHALPGGFLSPTETTIESAARELFEETGVDYRKDLGKLRFVGLADDPDRDPRGRVVTAVYAVAVNSKRQTVKAGDDAAEADWHPIGEALGMDLAFDHDVWLERAAAMVLALDPTDLPIYAEVAAEFDYVPE